MEESPGGRSPAFSGEEEDEEDAVNRRVSSGSPVPPSCPRGPGDPAKSLQGSAAPPSHRREGEATPPEPGARGAAGDQLSCEAGPLKIKGKK